MITKGQKDVIEKLDSSIFDINKVESLIEDINECSILGEDFDTVEMIKGNIISHKLVKEDFYKQDKYKSFDDKKNKHFYRRVEARRDVEQMVKDFGKEDIEKEGNKEMNVLKFTRRTATPANNDEVVYEVNSSSKWYDAFDYARKLEKNQYGNIKNTLYNLEVILLNDPRIENIFFNELTKRFTVDFNTTASINNVDANFIDALPVNYKLLSNKEYNDFDNSVLSTLVRMFESSAENAGYGIKFKKDDIRDIVENIASTHTFNPIVKKIESVKWDGISRINTLFTKYCGCPETEYYAYTSRLLLTGAISRVVDSGRSFDYMFVLEGKQDLRKSSFIRALSMGFTKEYAQKNFEDVNKLIEGTRESWLVEIPEINALLATNVNILKDAISRNVDTTRLAYDTVSRNFKRSFLMIGTTNQTDYLRDKTGNRRFIPISISSEILIENIIADAPQIWAEAMEVYKQMKAEASNGVVYFNIPYHLKDTVKQQQKDRMEDDSDDSLQIWKNQIEDFCNAKAGAEPNAKTCLVELWVRALGYNINDYKGKRNLAVQLTALVSELGYVSTGKTYNDTTFGKQKEFIISNCPF